MSWKSVWKLYELLDRADINGTVIADFFAEQGAKVRVETLAGETGTTDLVEVRIAGSQGKSAGGKAPTLCIAGSLGGVGGRPAITGIVSDADGALVALASGLKLLTMKAKGDAAAGDVVVRTTICGNAPTMPHHPVPFMSSHIDFVTLKKKIVDLTADAVVITETSRGNRIANYPSFGITPTVKEGWILKVSEDALDIMERVTGEMSRVIPLSMQDITPVTNGLHHLNGLGELPEGCRLPCLGVGLTSVLPISGAAPGVTNLAALEPAVRFVVEVAKEYGAGNFRFYEEEEYQQLCRLYGPMSRLFTPGQPE